MADSSRTDARRQPSAARSGEISLSVFIPALNEEEHLEATVETVLRALADHVPDFEILIVNDGSSDRTPEIADRLVQARASVRAIHHPARMGLGKSYTDAVDAATKDYFVFIPGDNSWPEGSISALIGQIGSADIVTSFATNPWARLGGPLRRFVSAGYTVALNLLYGLDLRYYNGLTIYPTTFLRTRPISTFGFGFAAEALLHGIHRGMSFVEVGVPIQELEGGASKAVTARNIFSVGMTVLRTFWHLRVCRVYGVPRGRRNGIESAAKERV